MSNGQGQVTRYEFTPEGYITSITDPLGNTRVIHYTDQGDILRVIDPQGNITGYAYNDLGQLTNIYYPDGGTQFYGYDDEGHLNTTQSPEGRYTIFVYRDHLLRYAYPGGGASIAYAYNEQNLLCRIQAEGRQVTLSYDGQLNLSGASINGQVQGEWEYDAYGRPLLNRNREKKLHRWAMNDRLTGIIDELTGHGTFFQYDPIGTLIQGEYPDGTKIFRTADAVGNLYQSIEGKDRTYAAGGRLPEKGHARFLYDSEGNLTEKVEATGERWRYEWNANGMLRQVVRPDLKRVSFEYDALGRRTAKIFNGQITRWVWDSNTPLHEWRYELADRPEPTDHLVTWVFEEGTFKPSAKITSEQRYSILTEYLGTPVQMYDGQGELSWQAQLDVYGKVRTFTGASATDCPFRYQGQYEDEETGLYYNRFRYYSPEMGGYISQDPIGLAGGNPTLYGYVSDTNSWVDVFGLLTIKLGGYVIRVHAEDADPWPSTPHGHIYDKGLVVDSEGIIYKAHKGEAVDKFSKKDKAAWKEFLKKCK